MPLALQPHPDSIVPAAVSVEVGAIRSADATLVLRYALIDPSGDIVLPARAEQAPADGLWRHSCFEAFVRTSGNAGYHEFNFAPSTRWAAYRFDDYRSGMVAVDLRPTRITTRQTTGRFALYVTLDLASLGLEVPWQLALTTVLEDSDGRKSYWALAHPPGAPDFHHPDCFRLELAPPARP